jgi:hypothetical protein
VVLLVGISGTAAFAENGSPPPLAHTAYGGGDSRGLLDRLFGNSDDKPKPDAKKPDKKDPAPNKPDKDAAPAKSEEIKKPAKIVDEAAAERKREQDTLLRRLAVCDKLQEIAFQTRDAELQHTAEQLAEKAQAAYSQRIAHLPCSSAGAESDEQILDRHLGAGATDKGRPAGTAASTVRDKNGNGRTAAREETP